MYHSLIISGRNTYDTWGMVPTSRPLVNPPEVKTNYVDVPGSDGVLDYTELFFGRPAYGQRSGSWEFMLRPGTRWAETYGSIMNYLHGRSHRVILEDDPYFFYSGRLSVNEWKSDPTHSILTIDYNLDPFRQSLTATDDTDWLWDEVFSAPIRYGRFTVVGTKYRNFINEGFQPVSPLIVCTAAMSVEYGGETYGLIAGRNHNANLTLQTGDNTMVFTGNGDVTFSYREISL